MSLFKLPSLACLAGLSLASAGAQTLTLTLDSITGGPISGHAGSSDFKVPAGSLNFTLTGGSGADLSFPSSLSLYCVEIKQTISLHSTHVYVLVAADQASNGVHFGASANIPLAGIGSLRARSLEVLYGHVFGSTYNPSALNSMNKLAFQLAVWELSHDDGFTLTSGSGNQLWFTSTGAAVTQAQAWVDWVAANYNDSSAPFMSLSALHNETRQDFLIPSASLGVLSAIPEPSTFALLTGVAAMSVVMWRRKVPARI